MNLRPRFTAEHLSGRRVSDLTERPHRKTSSVPNIRLGISTCPNDTFAFAGLLTDTIRPANVRLDIQLMDIEQLNAAVAKGHLDVAKVSFAAAAKQSNYTVLPVGSALGYGVGPLLLASASDQTPEDDGRRTLCPGADTTATMLMQLFHPDASEVRQVVFSEIMPALQDGRADFGVCIHEGRFTWQQQGLHLVEDLGQRWERQIGCPLPLGGLVARDDLDSGVLADVVAAIDRSLEWARQNPRETIPTMRRHAQSLRDDVLMSHVDLYVNDWTTDLGEIGRNAITRLFEIKGTVPKFYDRPAFRGKP